MTPEMAKEILRTKTRRDWVRRDESVIELVSKIKSGNWIPDQDPIAIGSIVRSGHHRLTAIAEAGIPVEVLIWDTFD